ncbi:hypothetical protein GPJ56_000448 [Histomonas meleagridis]|uniref:uncharacterized protein n=1 Tax=Histomonas meleagridis TaxID=135588 RepID=UPI0035596FD9|nr:hypothetical protein GPJ56_000448 [Histomonas meleagridis]KAH0796512.1 hypothetical protein GO595_010405 [Histomonas meleagridis]
MKTAEQQKKEKELQQRQCSDAAEKFNKASVENLVPIIEEFKKYIPNFSSLLISKIFPKLTNLIATNTTPREVNEALFSILLLMLSKANPNIPETDPYNTLYSDPDFLAALFLHTGLDEHGKFNKKVIEIFAKYLIVKDPTKIVSFLIDSKESVFDLMNGLTHTNDVDASILFNQLVVCHPNVKSSFVPTLKPILKRFPPHLVVDLMIASQELKDTMTQEEFEQWLDEQNTFTLSDVHQVIRFYSDIWNKDLLLRMILRTAPPQKYSFVDWFHTMPSHSLQLSPELTTVCVQSILDPKYEFEEIDDISALNYGRFNTIEPYLYSRLFVLTHADPKEMPNELIEKLYELLNDESDFVLAGVLQVISQWAYEKEFELDKKFVYRIARQMNIRDDESLKHLCRMTLHAISNKNKVARAVLLAEESLRMRNEWMRRALRPSWIFPNMKDVAKNLPLMNGCTQESALTLLGFVDEYLSQ